MYNAEYAKKYRLKHPSKFRKSSRKYYRNHRDEILVRMYGVKKRKCQYCGADITNVSPRTTKFCNDWHKSAYRKEYAKKWYLKKKHDQSKKRTANK